MLNKMYRIITIGCQMNISDSERLAGKLEQSGYKKTDDKYGADLVVINTCGVRQSAENRIYGLIPRIKKENPKAKIILTGCLAERKDVKRRLENYVDVWMPIGKIFPPSLTLRRTSNFQFSIFNKFLRTNDQINAKHGKDYLEIKPKYESKYSAYVSIGNGCNNFCSYCVVPYARGREVYRSAKDVLKEVRGLVKKGYKEVILIAQNVNSYKSEKPPKSPFTRGTDNNPPSKGGRGGFDFADLLKMVNDVKGDFWIRFFTSHPKDMSDKLIKAATACEKVCHQVHLAVQAGDDKVLEKMNRGYTADSYIKLVNKIRKRLNFQFSPLHQSNGVQAIFNFQTNSKLKILNSKLNIWQPPVCITTDVIVGFPGETKRQFANTAKLFKLVKYDMAYISEYSGRPGTAAFKLKDNVSAKEKRNRKNQLDKILRQTALANNKKYIGKTVKVLVENLVKTGEWFGKTATGKDIRFSAKRLVCQAGDFVKVKVTGAREFCLAGILMK